MYITGNFGELWNGQATRNIANIVRTQQWKAPELLKVV
jgi:hypothetical protein